MLLSAWSTGSHCKQGGPAACAERSKLQIRHGTATATHKIWSIVLNVKTDLIITYHNLNGTDVTSVWKWLCAAALVFLQTGLHSISAWRLQRQKNQCRLNSERIRRNWCCWRHFDKEWSHYPGFAEHVKLSLLVSLRLFHHSFGNSACMESSWLVDYCILGLRASLVYCAAWPITRDVPLETRFPLQQFITRGIGPAVHKASFNVYVMRISNDVTWNHNNSLSLCSGITESRVVAMTRRLTGDSHTWAPARGSPSPVSLTAKRTARQLSGGGLLGQYLAKAQQLGWTVSQVICYFYLVIGVLIVQPAHYAPALGIHCRSIIYQDARGVPAAILRRTEASQPRPLLLLPPSVLSLSSWRIPSQLSILYVLLGSWNIYC